jgi:small-conductance mechanosensitive channel
MTWETFTHYELLENPAWRWALALGVAAATLALGFVLRRVLPERIQRLTERTKTVWDDAVVDAIAGTRGWFLVLASLLGGAKVLALPEDIEEVIAAVTAVVILVQVGLWMQATVKRALDTWRAREEKNPHRVTLVAGAGMVARIVIWSLVLLLLLNNLGVEISALVAGLGIGGVAAALAVQNVLGDVFSAVSIYLDRPFDIGEFVIVGDTLGTVTRVGWRSSRVRALSGEETILPNSDLAGSRIRNYGRMSERRVVLQLGVRLSTPMEEVKALPEALKRAVEGVRGVRFDRAHFKGFGASSLDYEIVFWVLSPDYNLFMDYQQEILLNILRELRARDVSLAFPTRTLHVQSLPQEYVDAARAA